MVQKFLACRQVNGVADKLVMYSNCGSGHPRGWGGICLGQTPPPGRQPFGQSPPLYHIPSIPHPFYTTSLRYHIPSIPHPFYTTPPLYYTPPLYHTPLYHTPLYYTSLYTTPLLYYTPPLYHTPSILHPPLYHTPSILHPPSIPHPLYTTPPLYHTPSILHPPLYTTPPLYYTPPPVVNMTHVCENITFPHTSHAIGKIKLTPNEPAMTQLTFNESATIAKTPFYQHLLVSMAARCL